MTEGNGTSASRTALVVEDEAWVAFDLEDMLRDLGFEEVVVCGTFALAEETLAARDFPVAVFDLNLDGRISTPLIERALASGTHVVVTSGYETDTMPLEDASIPRLVKPYAPADLARALGPRAPNGG